MGKIMILNASPRAPRSNSKRYAEIFLKYTKGTAEYFNITKTNHMELCSLSEAYSDVLFVFPLYADAVPVTLLNFLKSLEKYSSSKKPTISVLINCGFIEYKQNNTAVKMVELFCKQNCYSFGSVLKIGSGEAILDSPFKFLVTAKIRKLSRSICNKNYITLKTTMPLPKSLFLKASTQYWIKYGQKYGTSEEEMQTMKIE